MSALVIQVEAEPLRSCAEMPSEVFRDAGYSEESDVEHRVEFTDHEIEDANNIKLFVQLLQHGTVGVLTLKSKDQIIQVARLVMLLKKYDCKSHVRDLAMWAASTAAIDPASAPGAFVIGAVIEDLNLCFEALSMKIMVEDHRHSLFSTAPLVQLALRPVKITPGDVPFELWRAVSPKCLWALARACQECGDSIANVAHRFHFYAGEAEKLSAVCFNFM